jgi:cytochrome c biogenesis protein CcmG/thiol:disulfide interchange protein DsbE
MNFKLIATLTFALFLGLSASAQDKIPSIQLKDLVGNMISSGELENDGKPMVISFWATWCKPCIRELNAINDVYFDWQEETGVKVVAISVDDSRNSARVKPFTASQGWEYEIYIDENQELKRALNVNNIPHTFLVDGKGNIVWQHNGYIPGDEDHLFELISLLAAGESIEGHE